MLAAVIGPDNKVLTFNPARRGGQVVDEPTRIGWHQASTIPGFCSLHDSEVFRPLETAPFAATRRQCLLLGYRAICHEVFRKQAAAAGYPEARRIIDQGIPPNEQRFRQEILTLYHMGVDQAIRDLLRSKAAYEDAIFSAAPNGITLAVIRFHGTPSVVCSGAMTPDYDLAGNQLQDLGGPDVVIQGLTISMDVSDVGGALVFSWMSSDPAPRAFVDSLLALSTEKLEVLLPQLPFYYLENTYFSDAWWAGLSADQKMGVARLANAFNPEHGNEEFLESRLTPWVISSIDFPNE